MGFVDELENILTNDNGDELGSGIDFDDSEQLHQFSHLSREALQMPLGSTQKVLLGAGWVDQHARRMLALFPEVLFVDSTHKTNNEGRPLLMICGRDNTGRGFVAARIFMPNETGAFYRWIFHVCLPNLFGKQTLQRVR